MCKHENFAATVEVGRLKPNENAEVDGFSADIRIRCADCDLPFEFVGFEAGSSPLEPRVSVDAQELRVPITPQGKYMISTMPGFTIRRTQ